MIKGSNVESVNISFGYCQVQYSCNIPFELETINMLLQKMKNIYVHTLHSVYQVKLKNVGFPDIFHAAIHL